MWHNNNNKGQFQRNRQWWLPGAEGRRKWRNVGKRYKLSVIRISPDDLMYRIETIVNNIVLYTEKLLRVDHKCYHSHAAICMHTQELTMWGDGSVNYFDLGNYFTIYMDDQFITLYTLCMYNSICQFFLSKVVNINKWTTQSVVVFQGCCNSVTNLKQ